MMQPFHYDLRYPAAKDNSFTHAAMAPSNFDAAICNQRANKRNKSRTHEQPLIAESEENRFDLETTAAAPVAHRR